MTTALFKLLFTLMIVAYSIIVLVVYISIKQWRWIACGLTAYYIWANLPAM
jgi:hypothetical protein